MTTTPRTDAAITETVNIGELSPVDLIADVRLVIVSRQIERELTASRAECERLREALQAAVTTETLYQRPFAISGPWLERARAALQGDV